MAYVKVSPQFDVTVKLLVFGVAELSNTTKKLKMSLFEKTNGVRLVRAALGGVATWLTIASGLTWLWPLIKSDKPELIWAITVTTGFFLFYLSILLCYSRQAILLQRIEEMAKAKGALELAFLKNRVSSKSKNK